MSYFKTRNLRLSNGIIAQAACANLGRRQCNAYDANGNLTSDGSRTRTWDEANRLKTVMLASNTVNSPMAQTVRG
ncbi:RHS repeat protein [Mesorhizobium sp. M4B.F.Ca.ET.017.02.2.1]|uniref:RHS repeat protein n=1 Tax=Mesorhizobium sp. M4B.F.Ca.ET.017.02.2.1 TaxID=2496649 RepID=UPI001677FF2F|nr:RHS repeat protein [Mesorhizobium sp. M4B.F.Ca.ET.017.02.2.1]